MSRSDLELIWKFLEGEMDDEGHRAFEKRLAADPSFQDLFLEQQDIFRALSKEDSIEFRRKIRQIAWELKRNGKSCRIRFTGSTWLMAAAIGLVFISAGYFLFRWVSPVLPEEPLTGRITQGSPTVSNPPDTIVLNIPGNDRHSIQSIDTLSAAKQSQDGSVLMAESFTIHPFFEELLDIHFRSAGMVVHSPKMGQTFAAGTAVPFSLDRMTADSSILVIYTNKGQMIHEIKMPSLAFELSVALSPGLYYFQIHSSQAMVFAGKFYIR